MVEFLILIVTLCALTMFIADRLIYLELPKTGSSHITKLLEQSVGLVRLALGV